MRMCTCASKGSADLDVFANPSLTLEGAPHFINCKTHFDIRESNAIYTVVYVNAIAIVMGKLRQGVRKGVV